MHGTEMYGNVRRLGDHLAGCVEQRRRAVTAFTDVGRHGRMNEHQAHLLGDRSECVAHDFQAHRAEPAREKVITRTAPRVADDDLAVDQDALGKAHVAKLREEAQQVAARSIGDAQAGRVTPREDCRSRDGKSGSELVECPDRRADAVASHGDGTTRAGPLHHAPQTGKAWHGTLA